MNSKRVSVGNLYNNMTPRRVYHAWWFCTRQKQYRTVKFIRKKTVSISLIKKMYTIFLEGSFLGPDERSTGRTQFRRKYIYIYMYNILLQLLYYRCIVLNTNEMCVENRKKKSNVTRIVFADHYIDCYYYWPLRLPRNILAVVEEKFTRWRMMNSINS